MRAKLSTGVIGPAIALEKSGAASFTESVGISMSLFSLSFRRVCSALALASNSASTSPAGTERDPSLNDGGLRNCQPTMANRPMTETPSTIFSRCCSNLLIPLSFMSIPMCVQVSAIRWSAQ